MRYYNKGIRTEMERTLEAFQRSLCDSFKKIVEEWSVPGEDCCDEFVE